MSIRNKLLLGIALIFLLNLVLLGGYYQFYLKDEVSGNLQNAQLQVEETTRKAADLIEQHTQEQHESLLSAAEFHRYDFTVTDARNGEVLYGSHRYSGDLEFHSTTVARVEARILLVESTRHFMLGAIRALSLVQQMMAIEAIIIAVVLVLMAVALQAGLIRPLAELNNRMQHYRQGKKLPPATHSRKDELGQLAQEFDRLTHALDEEKRLQERIIASISHDIKTPLTSVMGYVERLLKGNVKDEARVRQYLQTIYDRAQSIDGLVADFDGYLASSAQTLKKPVSADFLCGLIREEYKEELTAGGAALVVENQAGATAFQGDLSKLRRVFGNLIGNAVKHAVPEGRLEIRFLCQLRGDLLEISVQDNGAGVPTADLEHIFEPFYTGNTARGGGSGLGLSICSGIVEAHGGTVRAESPQRGGLNVIISMPLISSQSSSISQSSQW